MIGRMLPVVGFVAACSGGTLVVPEMRTEMTPLAEPARPEDLLGHAATVGDAGRVSIGTRSPGCIARAEDRENRYQVAGRSAHHGAAFVGGGSGPVAASAKIEGASSVEYRVENTRVVTASFEGPCGERVVRKVYVGSGTVRFWRSASASAGASAAGVAAAGAEEGSELLHEVSFEDAAYAVEVGEASGADAALRVDVDLPAERLPSGTPVEARIFASRSSLVLLAAVDGAGQAYVLLPSLVRAAPRAGPDTPLVFPSEEEAGAGIRLVPRLPEGATEASESLVVWAFLDESPYREVVPLRTAGRDYVVEPLASLEEKVERARASVGPGRMAVGRREYVIVSAAVR